MIERRRDAPLFTLMNIVDLRQTTVRQLEPLLEEESLPLARRIALGLSRRAGIDQAFPGSAGVSGCVAFENGNAAGYAFYVMEEQKGLIGGLYVSAHVPQSAIAQRLLEEMLYAMRAMPQLARIEAQLMPLAGRWTIAAAGPGIPPLHAAVHAARFAESRSKCGRCASTGCEWIPLDDRYFDPCAKLILSRRMRITWMGRSTINTAAYPARCGS